MPTPRAQARAQMEARILAAGREQLRDRGAAALSLREVARSLGVVSSAVYRYVASRDELLTLLLVDTYTDLAEAVDRALDTAETPRGRLAELAGAMRAWAREHPEQWALVYGSPVPGYAAPEATTSPPGTRVMGCLLAIAAEGAPRDASRLPREYRAYLAAGTDQFATAATPQQAAAAVGAWCAIVGAISMEMFGQLGPLLPEAGAAVLEDVVATQADRLGLTAGR